MRYIRYAFLAALAIVLVAVAMANRGVVTLQLLPDQLADVSGMAYSIDLPLFVVIFGGIVAGLFFGELIAPVQVVGPSHQSCSMPAW